MGEPGVEGRELTGWAREEQVREVVRELDRTEPGRVVGLLNEGGGVCYTCTLLDKSRPASW